MLGPGRKEVKRFSVQCSSWLGPLICSHLQVLVLGHSGPQPGFPGREWDSVPRVDQQTCNSTLSLSSGAVAVLETAEKFETMISLSLHYYSCRSTGMWWYLVCYSLSVLCIPGIPQKMLSMQYGNTVLLQQQLPTAKNFCFSHTASPIDFLHFKLTPLGKKRCFMWKCEELPALLTYSRTPPCYQLSPPHAWFLLCLCEFIWYEHILPNVNQLKNKVKNAEIAQWTGTAFYQVCMVTLVTSLIPHWVDNSLPVCLFIHLTDPYMVKYRVSQTEINLLLCVSRTEWCHACCDHLDSTSDTPAIHSSPPSAFDLYPCYMDREIFRKKEHKNSKNKEANSQSNNRDEWY